MSRAVRQFEYHAYGRYDGAMSFLPLLE